MRNSISKFLSLAVLSTLVLTTSCSSDDEPSKGDGDGSTFVLDRDNLKGEINDGEVILESGTYKLTGKLIVNANAKLTIKAGVTVEATSAEVGDFAAVRYIAVAQDGQIDIQGTSFNPVVMTATTQAPGSWGGLVICGRAPINKGLTASAEVSDLTYGGTEPTDSSGSIRYLRLEYTGFAYNSEKEFNGLSLFGVGSGTTIEYVQAYEGSDDGFEWFGGTVNANNLVVFNSHEFVGDDLFDWTEGWVGSGQNWYGKRTNNGNRGIEADNNANNEGATPISNPTISNITLIGNGAGSENHAIKLRVGTKGQFDNVVLSNWGTGFDVQSAPDLSSGYVGTDLAATNVKFDNVTTLANATATGIYTLNDEATGAGNGTGKPSWANGWTLGL